MNPPNPHYFGQCIPAVHRACPAVLIFARPVSCPRDPCNAQLRMMGASFQACALLQRFKEQRLPRMYGPNVHGVASVVPNQTASIMSSRS